MHHMRPTEISMLATMVGVRLSDWEKEKLLDPFRELVECHEWIDDLVSNGHNVFLIGKGVKSLVDRIHDPITVFRMHKTTPIVVWLLIVDTDSYLIWNQGLICSTVTKRCISVDMWRENAFETMQRKFRYELSLQPVHDELEQKAGWIKNKCLPQSGIAITYLSEEPITHLGSTVLLHGDHDIGASVTRIVDQYPTMSTMEYTPSVLDLNQEDDEVLHCISARIKTRYVSEIIGVRKTMGRRPVGDDEDSDESGPEAVWVKRFPKGTMSMAISFKIPVKTKVPVCCKTQTVDAHMTSAIRREIQLTTLNSHALP